jgi:hypothetical protein
MRNEEPHNKDINQKRVQIRNERTSQQWYKLETNKSSNKK